MVSVVYQTAFLLLAFMLLGVASISADVPVEGITQYTYQYLINNTAEYPEYTFVTSSEIWGFDQPSLVLNGSFGGGYKLDGFVLHAIKSADLSEEVLEELSSQGEDNLNLSQYFTTAPMATCELLLPVSTGMDSAIPLSNITVILHISEISGTDLNATREKTIYRYENGTAWEEMTSEETDVSLLGDAEPELLHII